jgi:hypothetical protein
MGEDAGMNSLSGRAPRFSCARALSGAALAAACCAAAHAERFSLEPTAADPAALDLAHIGLTDIGLTHIGLTHPGLAPMGFTSTQAPVDGDAPSQSPEPAPLEALEYGAADSVELELSVGPAFDFDGTTLGVASVGIHWFVADGVSFGVLGEAIWFDDGADDAFGGGAALVARWHFVRERDYSLFIEGGCGFAGFSSDVPSGGTDYDFTPRAALGFTYALDDGIRLVGRAGWFHISNGQTGPGNPGFDSASISLGLSFTLGD